MPTAPRESPSRSGRTSPAVCAYDFVGDDGVVVVEVPPELELPAAADDAVVDAGADDETLMDVLGLPPVSAPPFLA